MHAHLQSNAVNPIGKGTALSDSPIGAMKRAVWGVALLLALPLGIARVHSADIEPQKALATGESSPSSVASACLSRARSLEAVGDFDGAARQLLSGVNLANDDQQAATALLLEQARLSAVEGQSANARAILATVRSRLAGGHDGPRIVAVAIADLSLDLANPDEPRAATALTDGLDGAAKITSETDRLRALNDLVDVALDIVEAGGLSSAAPRLLATASEVHDAALVSGSTRDVGRAALSQARLYYAGRQFDDAASLARLASLKSQRARDPETTYRSLLLLAIIEHHRNDRIAALRDARLAVGSFDQVRDEVGSRYSIDPAGYRQHVGMAYLELVDLLLASAREAHDAAEQQSLREQAVVIMERFRTGELRDYLLSPCVTSSNESVVGILHHMTADAAVVYPVVLPDRMVVLLLTSSGIGQHDVAISSDELGSRLRLLRSAYESRKSQDYRAPGLALYEMLLKPFEDAIADKAELIYIPDSSLRLVPVSALPEGDGFVLDHHAVMTAPYLYGNPLGTSGFDVTKAALVGGISESVQGYPALPGVMRELDAISADTQPGAKATLRNADFTTAQLTQTLQGNNFSLIHLATHGEFSARSLQSYLVTYDGQLTLSNFERAVSRQAQSGELNLLTLSACQTAAGDDRSALGLAGLAIRAGARNTVATLWYVSDSAATSMMTDFYDGLAHGTAPVRALHEAQLKLRHSERYAHPDFWSPFIVISGLSSAPAPKASVAAASIP